MLFLFVLLPYLIGLIWHGFHPFVSVFTGDDKPRRLYVDENSAEPNHFRINHNKFKLRDQLVPRKPAVALSSLCRATKAVVNGDVFTLDRGNIQCRSINKAVDVLQITPIEGPVAVRSEAIVFVLPASADWITSPVHSAFLSFLVEVLQPQFNWLAKTFFVVAPRIRDGQVVNTTQTVNVFLEAYLGPSSDTDETVEELIGGVPVMPPGMISSALLRQLIVWDQQIVSESTNALPLPTVRLLPQGPRGLLPNMDLVSVVRAALQRALISNVQYEIHPYQTERYEWSNLFQGICQRLSGQTCAQRPLSAILNLLFFQHTLRGHDFTAPHAVALERGIDALTIQYITRQPSATTVDRKSQGALTKLPSAMEVCLRSLSNLHERLHHSTSLYLLLDIDHFVKHEEYLVPNLLLLVPLIVRAAFLLLFDVEHFDWYTVALVAERTILATLFVAFGLEVVSFVDTHTWWIIADNVSISHVVVGLIYIYVAYKALTEKIQWSAQACRSVQFMACLWALYTHVAIAFGHVSLAFPSALFWTPLIAFPFYRERADDGSGKKREGISRILCYIIFILTAPFVWFVPHVLPTYTPYVCYAYVPLHFILSHLWLH